MWFRLIAAELQCCKENSSPFLPYQEAGWRAVFLERFFKEMWYSLQI